MRISKHLMLLFNLTAEVLQKEGYKDFKTSHVIV